MSNDKLIEWKKKGEHLPKFLRSKEDQSNLLRLMSFYYGSTEENNPLNNHSLGVLNQYLFDIFLDYFADNGITLQPIKHKNIEFLDLEKELNTYKDFESGLSENFTLQTTTALKMYEIDLYRNQLLFLPTFMNTFDQFKYIFRELHNHDESLKKYGHLLAEVDYRTGTIFMVDFVLWFCVKYGYKLQRSKKRIDFCSYF